MLMQDTQEIAWVEYFEQQVANHPELNGNLIEAIRAELQAIDNKKKPPLWQDDRPHQALMVQEAQRAIAKGLATARQRLRLQRYDEFCLGSAPRFESSPVREAAEFNDELDDLLLDLCSGDATDPANSQSEAEATEITVAVVSTVSNEHSGNDRPATEGFDLQNYYFPHTEDLQTEYQRLSNVDLRVRLDQLLSQRDSNGRLISYMEIRNECCAIGEVMNHRRIQPPKLRPQRCLPKLPKGEKYSTVDTVMARDRQVLDLHWLHCNGKRDRLGHKAFADLFEGDDFDFDLAGVFACKGWSMASKTVKALDLDDFEQIQMAYFRMKHIDDAWRNAENSMNTTIAKRLRKATFKEPDFAQHIEGLKQLWLAEKMSQTAGIAGQKIIGQIYGWLMNEEPLSKATLHAKLKRMRRRTAPESRRGQDSRETLLGHGSS